MKSLAAAPFAALALLALSACGGSGATANLPQTSPSATPAPPGMGDDWVTMGHDFTRSGYQGQSTGITPANVATLVTKWKVTLPVSQGGIVASPLVFDGVVVVATRGVPITSNQPGVVYALSATTGQVLWSRPLAGEIRATPTIADNHVFVGDRLFGANANDILASHIYSID
ncbi:MAG: PQQ-binding-like beta-propeller repeat protein, partial [Vulcanimicrobiaceae bacterium]